MWIASILLPLTACVTAVDESLPYDKLPQITTAANVRLVASPAHLAAELNLDPIPVGETVQVVGTDSNAASLLVLHDNQLGWMPTIFSRSNVGNLNAAVVVEPLPADCTTYLGEFGALDENVILDEDGSLYVRGTIYRPQGTNDFADAALTLQIDGESGPISSDYVHTPLTESSRLILFGFAVDDAESGASFSFDFADPSGEGIFFQAVLFAQTCNDGFDESGAAFAEQLPVGLPRAELPERTVTERVTEQGQSGIGEGDSISITTSSDDQSTAQVVATADPIPAEVVAEILSTRAGPNFAFRHMDQLLQGSSIEVIGRTCSVDAASAWLLLAQEDGVQHWIPAADELVLAQGADEFTCLEPPPLPDENASNKTILTAQETTVITDEAEFEPYLAAISRYRLAEKAALAMPHTVMVHQMPDFAHDQALANIQREVRQLRIDRQLAELLITTLEPHLVVRFENGTASVLMDEGQILTHHRPRADGRISPNNKPVDQNIYHGPTLYSLTNLNNRWSVGSVVQLGIVAQGGTPATTNVMTNPEERLAEKVDLMRQVLVTEKTQSVTPIGFIPRADFSDVTEAASSTLEGAISENMRLTQQGSPYIVSDKFTIQADTTLYVEPGAILKFKDDAFLEVNGALYARGTAQNSIIFTSIKDDLAGGDTNGDGGGSAPASGDWTMIRFNDSSTDANSIITYAEIRYAGEHNGTIYGAIQLHAASPTIGNSIIEDSLGYAVAGDVNSFPVINGNYLQRNGGNGFYVAAGSMRSSGMWRNTDIPYVVPGAITIDEGATLSIAAGVSVKLVDDAFFDVYGGFYAVGTPEEQIIFTSLKDDSVLGDTNGDEQSTTPSAGDWTMIRFRDSSSDSGSRIEESVIRYAGDHSGTVYGAIELIAASPTIHNNIIEESFWYAIAGDVNSYPIIQGNQIQKNAGNGFVIREGAMRASGAWKNTDIIYSVLQPITINDGATLSINPDVKIKLGDNALFDVYGAFRAIGTSEQPIIFTSLRDDTIGGDTNGDEASSSPAAGDWTMIRFKDSSSDANSTIEQSIIRYAGKHNDKRFGAIHLEAASPTIQNNIIEDSLWYVVSGDVYSDPLVSGNQIARNGGNGVEIRGGSMNGAQTWENTDIVYAILSTITVNDGASLVFGPGVNAKFGNDVYIDVYGSFRASGTAEAPVTLTSLRDDMVGGDTNADGVASVPSAGDWTMIRFRDTSNDANSIIDHTTIRYAGEHNNKGFGAIHLEAASPTITNNLIEYSYGYVVNGDVSSFPITSNNEFVNNGGNGFAIRAGNISTRGRWSSTDIAYAVFGEIKISDGAALTIDPNVTVKFAKDSYFYVYGSLNAAGTEEQPITFTSLKDDTLAGDTNGDGPISVPAPGDWTYIKFFDSSNDSNTRLQYTTFRYGGKWQDKSYGVLHIESASPSISHSTFENNFAYGIWHDATSSPQLEVNEYISNGDIDIFIKPE